MRSLCLLVFKEQFTKITPIFETCAFFPFFLFHKPPPHLCCLRSSQTPCQSSAPIPGCWLLFLGVTSHQGQLNTHWMLLLAGFSMGMKLWVLQGGAVKARGWDGQSPGTPVHPLTELVAPSTSSAGVVLKLSLFANYFLSLIAFPFSCL